MATIECQDRAPACRGESKYCGVGNALLGLASLLGGQHVMTEEAKFVDDGIVQVFIGVEAGHAASCLFVGLYGSFDLVWMSLVVFPGSFQVCEGQIGMMLQYAFVR
jgi:hypothetical protein